VARDKPRARTPAEAIAELVAAGDVRVEVAEVLPLTDIQRAHELSESGHTRGKIILAVAASA
jgi:NADPH:quinone reductase-like Zn-dependent oxidoreductase